ncbi:hypothetical protein NOF04DRAFT_1398009 [Fusarium oxysporum II5]|nr:hypothetical protein NOF04DRAFT_1398009 [Fusarium oxysporum II5]
MIHVNDSIGIWDRYAPACERIRYLDGAGRLAGDCGGNASALHPAGTFHTGIDREISISSI